MPDSIDDFINRYNQGRVAAQPVTQSARSASPTPLPASNIPIPGPESVRTAVAQSIAGTPLERAVELGNQAVAGLVETFAPSPQAQEELGPVAGNLPTFLWDLASLPYILGEAGGDPIRDTLSETLEAIGAQPLSNEPSDFEEFIRSPAEYSLSTREWTNELLDVQDPENLGESLLRSTSVPLPVFRGRALSELGGMLLPLGQARTAPGVLAEQLIPGFVDAIIRTETDPLYGTSGEARIDRAIELYNMAVTAASGGSPEPMRIGDVYADMELPEDESGQTGLYVLGALATVLGAGAASAIGATIRRARYNSEVVDASEFMGRPERAPTADTETVQRPARWLNEGPISDATVVSRVADRNAPLHYVINNLQGVNQRTTQVMNALIDVYGSAHGRGGAVSSILRNGGSFFGQRIGSVGEVYRFVSTLPRDIQRQFADTMRALDLEATMRVAGKNQPSDVWSGNITYGRISQIANDPNVRANPQFIQYRAHLNRMAQELLDLRVRNGTVTRAEARALRAKYPDYIPLQIASSTPSELKKIGTTPRSVPGPNGVGVKAGEMRNPLDDLSMELERMMRLTADNDIRKGILRLGSSNSSLKTKQGQAVIESVGGSYKPKAGEYVNYYFQGGQKHNYVVRDSSLHHALSLGPNYTAPLLNNLRKIHQQFTTGYFAPLFALTSAQFDAVTTALLRRKGEGTGLLDQITRSAIGRPLSSVIGFDPSVLLSPITGGLVGTAMDTMEAIRNSLQRSLVNDGVMVSMLGRGNVLKLATIITNALEKSFVYQFKRVAGDSPDIVSDFSRGSRSAFSDAEYQRGGPLAGLRYNPLTRAGKLLVRNLQNGTRIQHALANRPLQLKSLNVRLGGRTLPLRYYAPKGSENDWLLAMSRTRRSNVDVGQVGFDPHTKLGRFGQGVVSSIPYANHSIRAIAEHIRVMRENPTGYFTTLAGMTSALMIYLVEQTESSDEFRQFFWHDLTANQRTMGVPFLGEQGEIAALVAHAPELRLVLGPLTEVIGTLMGYKSRQEDLNLVDGVQDIRQYVRQALVPGWSDTDTEDLSQSLLRGIGSVNPLSVPGVFGAGLSLLGVQPPEPALGRFGAQTYPDIRGQPDLDSDTVRAVEGVLEGLVGASAQPLTAMMHSLIGSARLDTEHGGTSFGEDIVRALSAFAGSYDDPRKYTVLSSLFDAEYRLSVADSTFHIMNSKRQGLEALLALGQEYIDNPGLTRERAPGSLLAELDLTDTELASIYPILQGLSSELSRTFEDISTVKDQRAELPFASTFELDGQTLSTSDRDVRTAIDNRLVQRSRYLHTYALDLMRDYEEQLSQALGRSFVLESNDVQSNSLAEAVRAPHVNLPAF